MPATRFTLVLGLALLVLAILPVASEAPEPVLRLGRPNLKLLSYGFSWDLSRDGSMLVAGLWEGDVALIDVRGLRVLRSFKAHDKDAKAAFLPDNDILTTGEDGRVLRWDATTGRLLKTLRKRGEHTFGFAVSRDGRSFASSTFASGITIADTQTGRESAVLGGPSDEEGATIHELAFSPDAKRLASSSWRGDVTVWDVERATLSWEVKIGDRGEDRRPRKKTLVQQPVLLAARP